MDQEYKDLIVDWDEDVPVQATVFSTDSEVMDHGEHTGAGRVLLWNLDRIDQAQAYNRQTMSKYTAPGKAGQGVHVFIVDTGVRLTHTDFGGRAQAGFDTRFGACAQSNNNICSVDDNGHGTHCAGTAAGTEYGVAPQANIHAVKVMSRQGFGMSSGIFQGMDWVMATGLKPAVVSMSLAGPKGGGTYANIIDKLYNRGITVVVAAGNENTDACTKGPAYVPNAITVGSTTSSDTMSSFSNYGTCVDMFAPGSLVLSSDHTSNTATKLLSGTSMACPHVSGAAAVLASNNPGITPAQIASSMAEQTALANAIANIPQNPPSPNRMLQVLPNAEPVIKPCLIPIPGSKNQADQAQTLLCCMLVLLSACVAH